MTVISGAPMPTPRLGSAFPATGQTAVTVSSATIIPTARPTYLTPGAFAPSALYGASNFQGMGLGRAAQAGRTRYIGRPTTAGWTMSQGRGGRFGAATVRPAYLHPQNFSPTVLYSAWRAQAQGLGRYGRRARLAGIERFAPSVLYGAYAVQAQGMGRYGQKRMGCCLGRYAGNRPQRLGDNPFAGIINAAQNVLGGLPINAPEAGGGWVSTTTNADNSKTIGYVDANGQSAIMTVPANSDGSPPTPDQLTAAVAATGAGTTPPILPPAVAPWVWGIGLGLAALLAYKVVK